ncbi:MAG: hypothetical protein HKN25_09800, partial [Pyrinomonadaceae bacterium]|nr:hypothetical protein [Pyrinomonadaceae bacterium]
MFTNLAALLKNKRFLLTLFLLGFVAAVFWSQSRYPELDHKLMMGADTSVQAIGFDVLVEMPDEPTFIRQVYVNTVNWMWTNRKGMAFGLLLGALMMNLLPFLNGLRLQSRVANSGLGILMGAPLGLCVNCSTPVAHGMHESGAKIETMLGAMISSPTLNVIVLTMLFAMFPPWLAFMKIGTTLVFILAVIPLLTRLIKPKFLAADAAEMEILNASSKKNLMVGQPCDTMEDDCDEEGLKEHWAKSAIWVVKTAFLNLWYLVKITVPLMLLAGLLGAIVVTAVPLDSVIRSLPEGRIFSWVSMAVLALIGLFVPAPMTFDVIVGAILFNAGLPIKYVAILLFTLGIFSIYPFMTIWNRISRQVAFSVFGSLLILGVAFGVVANRYQIWDRAQQKKHIIEPFLASAKPPKLNKIEREKQGVPASELLPLLKKDALVPETFTKTDQLQVSRIPFRSPHPAKAETGTMMRHYQQTDFGITEHDNISFHKMIVRNSISRGLSSGDVNRDGWTDFAVTSDAGLALYLNKNGTGFVQQRIEISRFNDKFIVNVAFVDLNNDGWLDIWLSALEEGNFVIYSESGDFSEKNMKPIENHPEAATTVSPGFGDIDRDGKLDIVLGNVSLPAKGDGAAPFQSVRNVWL